MFVIGIDPGLGVKSATGVVVFNVDTAEIVICMEIWTKETRLQNKLYEIASEIRHEVKPYLQDGIVVTEYFVMKGKGGESLQRLMGALFAALKDSISIIELQNVKVKMNVGGSGKATKQEVAEGVLSWFKNKNADSAELVQELIKKEKWDILDAAAIGIAGYLDCSGRVNNAKY